MLTKFALSVTRCCALAFAVVCPAYAQLAKSAPMPVTGKIAQALVIIAPVPPAPIALDTVELLALSQADGRAVFAFPDKQMVVVTVGDPVPRTRAVLTEVMPDKVALDEAGAAGAVPQLVWMHKGQGAAAGRIERFKTKVAPVPVAPAPRQQTLTLPPKT